MRASLVLNGESSGTLVITGQLLVAVDGGANVLMERKLLPHAIVGDMDSIRAETLEYYSKLGVDIVRFPHEKDETDLELALSYAFERGASEVEILNWHGERIDMILAMVGLISRFGRVVAVSERCDIGVLSAGRHELSALRGETWSILPLCTASFSLSGFRYGFDGVMNLEKPIGVSNESVGDRVVLDVREGKVVYVRWKRKPL